jgi:ketosteroid isomerase-like protein
MLRRAHAGFNRGDLDVLRQITADDVEWGTTGAWPGIDPLHAGRQDAVVRWAEDVRSVWEVFQVAIEDVLADTGDSLVVVERLNARGLESGVEVQTRVFSVYRFRGRQVVKRESFLDRAPALEAVGLRE